MGKEITVRGKKWERKNSLWIIWSLFGFSSISFLNIGIKAKEKKWIITGIIYFVVLWGGMIIAGDMPGKAGEILADAMMILYIVSIVHPFLVRKSYLKKYDMILKNNEVELEHEKIKRARESLERANEIKNIENEAKKVSENLKADGQAQVEGDDKRKEEKNKEVNEKKNNQQKNYGIIKVCLIIVACVIIFYIFMPSNGLEGKYTKSEGVYGQHTYVLEFKDGEFYNSWPEINYQSEPHKYTYDKETGEIKVDDYNHRMYFDKKNKRIIYYSGEGESEQVEYYYKE